MLRTTKPPRCKVCKSRLDQLRPGQVVHEDCIEEYVRRLRAEKAERLAKAERQIHRQAKEQQKGFTKLRAEAQDAFNAFIRERDRQLGCFVCDEPFPVGQLGGDFDAGHVRTRGAAGHLRFNEDNCHGECKACNSSFGAKPHEIEAGAIRRIGQERYEALKNDNQPVKWTRDDMREVRDTYRKKLKELKARTA